MTEVELKLTPLDAAVLDRLAEVDRLGPFAVVNPRSEQQANSFYDTRTRGFRRARVGFRRRTIRDNPMAIWTLKADGDLFKGVATRAEVELRLAADMPPALALQALRQRAGGALAEQVGDALADGQLPLAQPFLEMRTLRRLRDLHAADQHWQLELALDEVTLSGDPAYHELEIEAELKRGDERALAEVRTAIELHGPVRESVGSKLSRALDYIDRSATSSR